MTYQLTVEAVFDAGHRLLDYAGKCSAPHGHTYRAELGIRGSSVDDRGMVADFSELKGTLKAWIDENWDHAFLLNDKDVELMTALDQVSDTRTFLFSGENPTTENLAKTLFYAMKDAVGDGVHSVRIWETAQQSVLYAE